MNNLNQFYQNQKKQNFVEDPWRSRSCWGLFNTIINFMNEENPVILVISVISLWSFWKLHVSKNFLLLSKTFVVDIF